MTTTKFLTEVESINVSLILASDTLTDLSTEIAGEDYKVPVCYINYYQAINKLQTEIADLQDQFEQEFGTK